MDGPVCQRLWQLIYPVRVVGLITFRWHGTPVQVTTVTIAFVLPMAIISPIAGVFVDHWNVKRVMIASDVIRAGLIMMLVFVTDVGQIRRFSLSSVRYPVFLLQRSP